MRKAACLLGRVYEYNCNFAWHLVSARSWTVAAATLGKRLPNSLPLRIVELVWDLQIPRDDQIAFPLAVRLANRHAFIRDPRRPAGGDGRLAQPRLR